MLYLQQENQNGDKVADVAEQSGTYGHFFFAIRCFLLFLSLLAVYLKRFMAVPVPKRNWETGCPGPSGKLENIFLDRQGGRLSHFL